jgi:tRNA(Ile)-lysidine synthase
MAAARNKHSTDLPDRVAAFFAPRLAQGRRICVGLSGGRDSVALLHLLAIVCGNSRQHPSPFELSALHVHHGLSAHADRWADFCQALCRSLDIPLQVACVTVSGVAEEGLEAAARRARYAAFAGCRADWLALAHHRDDQAETLLLNLLRGAGVEGLAAMPEERQLAGTSVRLVRPLLGVARSEIEAWLAAQGHQWIEDDSNSDSRLRRNYLRNEVMPMLGRVFPEPAVALARAATHFGESAALAEEQAIADACGVVDGETLLLEKFNLLPLARRRNLLRHQLRRHGLRMPDARYLAEIVRQLAEASAGAAPVFELEAARLRVFRGRLYLNPLSGEPDLAPVLWQGQSSLSWAGGVLRFETAEGQGLSRERIASRELRISARRGGEHLRPDRKRPQRSLKDLLRESAVPVWERSRLPLLWCGEDLVWVAGIGCDEAYLANPDEAGLLPIWDGGDC